MAFPPTDTDRLLQKQIIEAILVSICSRRPQWYHDTTGMSDQLVDLYSRASRIYSPIDERRLNDWLAQASDNGDSQDSSQFLYLQPFEDEGARIPILSFAHDQNDESGQPIWRFRIAVFSITEDGTPESWMPGAEIPGQELSPNPSAVGFRYESPEGPHTTIHGYFHVQPITSFRRPGTETQACDFLPCPRYLPKQQPAFPLDASTFTEMLFCLFVSLYGVQEARKFITPIVINVLPNDLTLLKKQFEGMQQHNSLMG